MYINIIIDKSTFQLLNYDELVILSTYFKHNISPVLTMEILGDLRKEVGEGKMPPEERVKDFARKLFPIYTTINAHYKNIVKSDLLGTPPSLDGRPFVAFAKSVVSESGQKGQVIKITDEEEAIYKWREGMFKDADRVLSEAWRVNTTQEDLLKNLKESLISGSGKPTFKDFAQLSSAASDILDHPETQQKLLTAAISNYDVDAESAVKIFSKWHMDGMPLIKQFAPYAYHCLRVDAMFLLGLTSGLVTTRPTNRVDCEYLYYLPFCNVFTSNDKFHKNIAPFLLRDDQTFVVGEELKKSLSMIVNYFKEKGEEARKKFKSEPPIIEESIVYQLWRKYLNYPEGSILKGKVPEMDFETMKKKMDEFERAMKGEHVEFQPGEDTEFLVKESFMSMDDPCFCGSGKKVVDCCIPREKFIAMSEKKKF